MNQKTAGLTEPQAMEQIRALLDREPEVRLAAVRTLQEQQEGRGIGPLTRRLFDAEPQVREAASAALDCFGYGETAHSVIGLYELPRSEWERGPLSSLRPRLLEQCGGERDIRDAHHAAILIGQLCLTLLLPGLAAAVRIDDVFVRRAVAEAAWRLSTAAALPLAVLLAVSQDPIARKFAACALAERLRQRVCNRGSGGDLLVSDFYCS